MLSDKLKLKITVNDKIVNYQQSTICYGFQKEWPQGVWYYEKWNIAN